MKDSTGKVTLWERWKAFGKKIGDFQARVLLVFFYYVILAPFALVLRLCSDPLAIKPKAGRGWQLKQRTKTATIEEARRQF